MKKLSEYINEKLVISKKVNSLQKLCQTKLDDLSADDLIDAIEFLDNEKPANSEIDEINKFVYDHTADTYKSLIQIPAFIIYLLSRYLDEPDNDELYNYGNINSILYHCNFDDDFHRQKTISEAIFEYFGIDDIYEIINNYLDGKKKRSIDSTGYWNCKLPWSLVGLLINNKQVKIGDLDEITIKCVDDNLNPTWLYSKGVSENCIKKLNYDILPYECFGTLIYNPNFTKESFIKICSIAEIKEYNYSHTYNQRMTVPSYSNVKTNWTPRVIVIDGYKTNIYLLKKFFPEFDDEKIMKSIMDKYAGTKEHANNILEGNEEMFKRYEKLNK